MSNLEKQIKELKMKDSWDKQMEKQFPDIVHSAYLHTWKNENEKHVIFKIKDFNDIKFILAELIPTEKQTTIGSSGNDKLHTLETPFRFDIKNPAVATSSYPYCIDLNYISNGIDVDIQIPIDLLIDFTKRGQRTVTDCEYHYFVGISMSKLINHQLMTYEWKTNQMGWFGGNKTLLNLLTIQEIINYITK